MQIASSPTAGAAHFGEWKSLPHCYRNIKELSLLLERNAQCGEFACSNSYPVFARMSNYWGDAYSPHKMGR